MLFKKKKDKGAEATDNKEVASAAANQAPEAVYAAPEQTAASVAGESLPATEIAATDAATALSDLSFTLPEASADAVPDLEPVPTVSAALDSAIAQPAPVQPAQKVAPAVQPAPVEAAPEPPKPVVKLDTKQAVQDILEGKMQLLSLDFTTAQAKEIARLCIDSKQYLARQLDVSDDGQREVLRLWIQQEYSNLLILNKDQRHADLVNAYLEQKFKEQLAKWAKERSAITKDVAIVHSYAGQQVICYNYATKEGEAISYFDNSLGIPVRLKTEAAFKIKIANALTLVEKLDMELERIDLGALVNFIGVNVKNGLRDTILNAIENRKLSYYDLPRFFSAIKDKLAASLQAQFNRYGLVVSDVNLKDISITNNATEKFEKQYFALAEVARVKEFENKLEAASLKLYEQKAMIHDKYPNFQASMTEAEKDLALSRYLKRTGQDTEIVADEITQEQFDKRQEANDVLVTKASLQKPVEPQAPVASGKYRAIYGSIIAVWLAIGVALTVFAVVFAKNFILGACVLGAGVLVAVVWGIIWGHKLRYGMSKKLKSEYEKSKAEYIKNLEEYMAQNKN